MTSGKSDVDGKRRPDGGEWHWMNLVLKTSARSNDFVQLSDMYDIKIEGNSPTCPGAPEAELFHSCPDSFRTDISSHLRLRYHSGLGILQTLPPGIGASMPSSRSYTDGRHERVTAITQSISELQTTQVENELLEEFCNDRDVI